METEAPAMKSRKKLWIILGSILLLLILIGSFGSSGSNTSANAPATTIATPKAHKSNTKATSTTGSSVTVSKTQTDQASTSSAAVTAINGLIVAGSELTGSSPALGGCHFRTGATGQLLPDRTCTPGAIDAAVTQADIGTTICKSGYTGTIRPPVSQTDAFKLADMAAYSTSGTGELDHLVPLELGGSSDAHNLWFEPGKIPNPKDSIENSLHSAVCRGQIQLSQAQLLIATDWTTVSGETVPPAPVTTAPAATTATTTATPVTTIPVVGTTAVHGGSFCSVEGAPGVTSTGKPEVCKTSATDSRLRWRAA